VTYLIDSDLQQAYTSLTRLRQTLHALGQQDAEYPVTGFDDIQHLGGDPVMSVLRRLDWDKSAVKEQIAPIRQAHSTMWDAVDDMQALMDKADTAWSGVVYSKFRVVVAGFKDDYKAVHHAIGQLQADMDGTGKGTAAKLGLKDSVIGALEKLTGGVRDFADTLDGWITAYVYETVMDPTTAVDYRDGDDADPRNTVIQTFQALEKRVRSDVSSIADLQSLTKDHVAPLKLTKPWQSA